MGCNSSKLENKSFTTSPQYSENDIKRTKKPTKRDSGLHRKENGVISVEHNHSDDDSVGSIDETSESTDIESCETGNENDMEDNFSSEEIHKISSEEIHKINRMNAEKKFFPRAGDKSPKITPLMHLREQLIQNKELDLSSRKLVLELEHDRQLRATRKKLEKRQAMSVRRMKSLRKSKAEIRQHKAEQKRKIQTLEDEMLSAPSNICNEDNKKSSSNIKIVVDNNSKGDDKNFRTLFNVEQIVNEYRQDKLRVESAESYERLKQIQKSRRKIMKRKTSIFFGIKTTEGDKTLDSKELGSKKATKKNTWLKTNIKANTKKTPSVPEPKNIIKICIEEGAIGMSLAKSPERELGLSIKRIDKHNYYLQDYFNGKNEIKLGYILYSINDTVVFNFLPHKVNSILNTSGRPIELSFCNVEDLDDLKTKEEKKKRKKRKKKKTQ